MISKSTLLASEIKAWSLQHSRLST